MKYYDQDNNTFTILHTPTTTTITAPALPTREFYDPEEDCYYNEPIPMTTAPTPARKQPSKYAAGESPMDTLKILGLVILATLALAFIFPNVEPMGDTQYEAVWWSNLQG